MTRRESRELAFCLLFEQAVTGEAVEDIIQAAHEARGLIPDTFAEQLAYGVEENLARLDPAIAEHLRGWSLRRISKVALSLLRLAVYELLFEPATPAGVAINEAVELAKAYGSQGDPAYINGVLGSVAKACRPAEAPAETPPEGPAAP
ncbi:transcription antitermination factor NusB [Acutalibacter caecimuris]|uniref:transcription antitermination factor NusB n=1 Tax=Acutalibacter caecimuris TaxID=3093657 RepID=UPI002AC9B58F|nr:transcription antitermination factor NusB [Acutalibacter sp. M00118]